MCGVEVKMLANYLPDNEGSRQLYVYVLKSDFKNSKSVYRSTFWRWFELISPSKHNAAFLAKITYQLPTGVYFDVRVVDVVFVMPFPTV